MISRTSTQGYQSEPGNLAEIAKQLGVANILEGSVQKAGNQVRVNVHLVNVQTGSQLWAETYDRKLSDIFSVETEIAKGIAESLQAKLTGREEQALAAKPTNNPQAYDAYLRGLAFEARSNYSSDALFKAIDFYDLAVRLDPNFALAWARLSGVHALLYSNRRDTTAARRDAAKGSFRKCAETAAELARNPALHRVIINIGCCTITDWPKPHLDASAKCCQVTARSYTPLGQLREARDIGMKVLPIGSGASPSIHGIQRY